jgi:hypothetical protein
VKVIDPQKKFEKITTSAILDDLPSRRDNGFGN